jgi:hypothetical protein
MFISLFSITLPRVDSGIEWFAFTFHFSEGARLVLPGFTPGYAVNTPSAYCAPGGAQLTLDRAASTILLIGSVYYTCATNWPQKKLHAS